MTNPGAARGERRIGVYGGTFNPIHRGHLRAAECVAQALGLIEMIFVPCARPPHKTEDADDPIAPAAERLAWVELAVEGNPLFSVDPIEIERGGASYSVVTLEALRLKHAPDRIVFVLGHDAFVEMGSWREPERIFAMVDIAVTSRPPVSSGTLTEWLPEFARDRVEIAPDGRSGRHRKSGSRLELVEIDALDISSSEIRARLRAGEDVLDLVPERMGPALMASRCYTTQTLPGVTEGERRSV